MICTVCRREIADYSNFCYYCGARQVPSAPVRRLMRSRLDCKLAGVCGGIAEYLGVDSTLVRLVWALVTVLTGIIPGLVAYGVAWLIMPEMPAVPAGEHAAQHTTGTP